MKGFVNMYKNFDSFMEKVISSNPEQIEFHQAVNEVVGSIWTYVQDNPQYFRSDQ